MSRQRILVVDDEETLCEALRFNLEAEGFEVETAFSAEQALANGGLTDKEYRIAEAKLQRALVRLSVKE